MTAHLPECLHSRPCERAVRGTGDRHVVSGGRCDNCDDPCICPALRACTVRVLGEAADRAKAAPTLEMTLYGEVFTDLKRGPLVHLDTVLDLISVEHQERMERLLDRLAQEAP